MGGQALGQLVPHDVVRAVAAGAFVVMGVLMARAALSTRRDGRSLEACRNPADHGAGCEDGCWSWRVFGSTLALLFVAELGDKTQLSVLSLAGQYGSARAVFLGGALALTAVRAPGRPWGRGVVPSCSSTDDALGLSCRIHRHRSADGVWRAVRSRWWRFHEGLTVETIECGRRRP